MTIETRTWLAGPFKVVTKTGNSASGVAVYAGKTRVHFSAFSWGPSKCDALAMAVYKKDPLCCESVMSYLFRRIDFYVDGPGFLDAWPGAVLCEVAT